MRIAVSSQNFRTITAHAGKTRRFLIFAVEGAGAPREVERLDLPNGMALHDYQGADHPLFTSRLDAIITGSAGSGFVQRLARWGIDVHPTSETDPVAAVRALAAGEPLPPPAPHEH